MRLSRIWTGAALAMLATPAMASEGVVLPEPSGITLLAMGLAGVLIGRRMAAKDRSD